MDMCPSNSKESACLRVCSSFEKDQISIFLTKRPNIHNMTRGRRRRKTVRYTGAHTLTYQKDY